MVVLGRDEHERVGIGDAAEVRLHRFGRIVADAGVQVQIGQIDDVQVESVDCGDGSEEPARHDVSESALTIASDDYCHPERTAAAAKP